MTQTKNRNTRKPTTTKPQAQSTEGYVGEAEYMVESQILDGRINFQKLRGKKAKLKGETFKATRKEVWAERQEVKLEIERVKLQIDQDDLSGTRVEQVINRAEWVNKLANKAYKVGMLQQTNNGLRQNLLNAGGAATVDHLSGWRTIETPAVER